MSDDLISRRALLEAIDSSFVTPILKINMREEHKAVSKIWGIIVNMPTAFDKEKVIDELKRMEEESCKEWNEYGDAASLGEVIAFSEALKIVEKGGIE